MSAERSRFVRRSRHASSSSDFRSFIADAPVNTCQATLKNRYVQQDIQVRTRAGVSKMFYRVRDMLVPPAVMVHFTMATLHTAFSRVSKIII